MMRNMMPETWGTLGSAVLDMFRRSCPPELRWYLKKYTVWVSEFLNPYIQISIHEDIGNHIRPHKAYGIVKAYLSVNSSKDAKRFKAEMARNNDSKLILTMDENEETTDEFNGVRMKWTHGKVLRIPRPQGPELEKRFYRLKFHKRYKDVITESYLDHVLRTGKEIQARNRKRKLYTNGHMKYGGRKYWSHIMFEHPATFETLAMEKKKKEEIMEDLLTFTKSKDFYARTGKAWRRGYLLYGPPGTGKSTMIAAMANLLDYDVYDLELTSVKNNADLRRLLTLTTAKSIIVIEDIDCSLDISGTNKGKGGTSRKEKDESGSKVTLSGLLNFVDGLWSACAGERLIVFTTNHVDKLDPALKRRGRMDKHIELSYCKYEGFKVIAKNYLDLEEHPLFRSVEELLDEVEITPADVAENLMRKSANEGPEQSLQNLIQILEEIKDRRLSDRRKKLKTTK